MNAITPDGTTLAILDFANLFTLDTTNGAVGPKWPWTLAPRVVGFPQWVP